MTTTTIRLPLDATSPSRLAQRLTQFAAELKTDIPTRIATTVAVIGQDAVDRNLAGIPNLDGNARGEVYITKIPNGMKVVNEGDQVQFLEFGSGAAGASDPHPVLPETGIQLSSRIQWVYKNKHTGRFATSKGLPPQGHMLHAASDMRRAAPSVLTSEVRRAVAGLW